MSEWQYILGRKSREAKHTLGMRHEDKMVTSGTTGCYTSWIQVIWCKSKDNITKREIMFILDVS